MILTWEDCKHNPSLRWQCCCCPDVSYELTGTTGGWGDSKMMSKNCHISHVVGKMWGSSCDVSLHLKEGITAEVGNCFLVIVTCMLIVTDMLFGFSSYEQTMSCKNPWKDPQWSRGTCSRSHIDGLFQRRQTFGNVKWTEVRDLASNNRQHISMTVVRENPLERVEEIHGQYPLTTSVLQGFCLTLFDCRFWSIPSDAGVFFIVQTTGIKRS